MLVFYFLLLAQHSRAVLSRLENKLYVNGNHGSLCPTYPLVSPLTATDLQSSIAEVSRNISIALKSAPTTARGSVAVGLVYDQKLLWMEGFGNINDSGE